MSYTFAKLCSSITESSVWFEDDHTRIVWITMLAMKDRRGRVFSSLPGLAHRARVPLEAAQAAIGKFLAPDQHSRTSAHEGRRIEVIDGGWRLLNSDKYRDMRDDEARQEYQREWDRANRSKRAIRQNPTISDTIRQNPTHPTISDPCRCRSDADQREKEEKTSLSPVCDEEENHYNAPLAAPVPVKVDRPKVEQLHQLWENSTGMTRAIDAQVERLWFDWLRAGHAAHELSTVIQYLRRGIKAGERNDGALKLQNILNLDKFRDDLALATAKKPAQAQRTAPTQPQRTEAPKAEPIQATNPKAIADFSAKLAQLTKKLKVPEIECAI